MKTFAIHNGDLVLGPGGFRALTGASKVKQDLSVALREPFRSDRFHPRWGSVLPSFIGRPQDDSLQMLVKGEVHRVIQNYMVLQSEQIRRDQDTGRKPRYTHSEIVSDIFSVDVRSSFDRFTIRIILGTLSGEEVRIIQAVGE